MTAAFAAPAAAATWLGSVDAPAEPPPLRRELGCAGGGDLRLSLAPRDGGCWLSAELRVAPSAASIAARRAAGHPLHPDLAAGRISLSAPLAAGRRTVSVRYDGCRAELHVDGELADEEWPFGAVRPADGPALDGWRATPRALPDAALAAWHGRPLRDAAAAAMGGAAYWRPAGHDTAVGDVMLHADGDDLHLFWLFDRRGHGSRWGGGAHQFRHAASADLLAWRTLPAALPIRRPWEGFGTGAAAIDGNGAWHLAYQIHGERFAEGAGQAGIWLAQSDDGGTTWREHVARGPGGGDPALFRAHGRWHLVAWGRRHESDDLRSWRLAEPGFLPVGRFGGGPWPDEPPGVARSDGDQTMECPCLWTWNGWSYALMGRTGFWMARDALGPYWGAGAPRPRWDLYDGLMVPMAAVWRGRCLLAGWVRGEQAWGGVLVWRELLQEADGTLAMRWAPELIPPAAAWRALPPDGALPAASWRLEADLRPGSAAVALRLGDGVQLVLDPAARTAAWATPGKAGAEPMHWGREVAIRGVEGLDATMRLEVVAWRDRDGWVLDACLGGRRTLVCFRPRLEPRLRVADGGGGGRIAAMRIAELRRAG